MGQRVPFHRIPGLTPKQQQQLDRNFQEAAAQLDAGVGRVKVPYHRIPGFTEQQQRQIDRNFAELECTGGGGTPLTTINTSDTFSVAVANIGGTNTDALLGGAPSLWTATPGDNWPTNVTAGTLTSPVTGAGVHTINVELASTIQAVQWTLAQAIANNRIIGLNTRWVDINNYYTMEFYRASLGVQEIYITKNVAGVSTTLAGPYAHIAVVGDILKFTANGTALEVFLNGVSILTATDSDLTTGTRAGIYALGDNASKVTNFLAYT